MPRRVALQAVADADAALVLLGPGPGMDLFTPGKLYDYIGQDRQVLQCFLMETREPCLSDLIGVLFAIRIPSRWSERSSNS